VCGTGGQPNGGGRRVQRRSAHVDRDPGSPPCTVESISLVPHSSSLILTRGGSHTCVLCAVTQVCVVVLTTPTSAAHTHTDTHTHTHILHHTGKHTRGVQTPHADRHHAHTTTVCGWLVGRTTQSSARVMHGGEKNEEWTLVAGSCPRGTPGRRCSTEAHTHAHARATAGRAHQMTVRRGGSTQKQTHEHTQTTH
jgi:hypothetical protein